MFPFFPADIPGFSPVFTAHMEGQVGPSWKNFIDQNTIGFEKIWNGGNCLLRSCSIGNIFSKNYGKFNFPSFKPLVTQWSGQSRCSVADLCDFSFWSFCSFFMHWLSCQWHELLVRTFLDDKGFTPCSATPAQTSQQIRNSVHEWVSWNYAWGLDFGTKLSTGYILPKLRPIINYSTSRKLGQAIGIALLEILNIVYSDLLNLQDVHSVRENKFACCFKLLHLMNALLNSINLTLRVSTIKWNMIEFLKLLILQFTVSVTCSKYLWTFLCRHKITSWNAHYVFFRVAGEPRASSSGNSKCLIVGIWSNFNFRTHFSTSGPKFSCTSWCAYGFTMGPYFMFCCCINERVQLFQVYPMLLSQPYFAHRYVDNRALILPADCMHQRQIQLCWKLDFYQKIPILLEKVAGNQLLWFCIDTYRRTITFCQPWTQILRSCCGSGTARNIKSGFTARIRLILHSVWSPSARDAQIQDLVGLTY